MEKKISTRDVKKRWVQGNPRDLIASPRGTYSTKQMSEVILLSDISIAKMAREGFLPREKNGDYVLIDVVNAYIKLLRGNERVGVTGGAGDVEGTHGDHKRRLLKANADLAETKAKQAAGETASLEEVTATWSELLSAFRQKILSIPAKLSPALAVVVDASQCNSILNKALGEALDELARTEIKASGAKETRGRPKGSITKRGTAARHNGQSMG